MQETISLVKWITEITLEEALLQVTMIILNKIEKTISMEKKIKEGG